LRQIDPGQTGARGRILTTPAVGDVNEDQVVEIAVGSSQSVEGGSEHGALYLLDGRGTSAPKDPLFANWPVTFSSPNSALMFTDGITGSPAMAKFGDAVATVAHGNGSSPFVLPANPGGQPALGLLPKFALPIRPGPMNGGQSPRGLEPPNRFGKLSVVNQPNTMFGLLSSPALGDIDQDGTPDIVTAGGSATLIQRLRGEPGIDRGNHQLAVWSGATGAMLPGSPFPLEDFSSLQDRAIADLDGDDYPEIIGGSGGPFLHAFNGCGDEPEGFPKFTGQWIAGTPAVGDLDGDGTLEVVVGTRSGSLYVWHSRGLTNGVIAWESFHHDNRNTGNLDTPLDQGVLHKAAKALSEEACRLSSSSPTFAGVGGCGCRFVDTREDGAPFALLVGSIAASFARRRVRRRSSR
jgi:hypothetical protein